jgi:hypothetical protein
MFSYSLAPPAEPARRAKDFSRVALLGWGMADIGDIAAVVVPELVTNALRHVVLSAQWMPGEHPFTLSLLLRDACLLCRVSGPASSEPVRVSPDAAAEGNPEHFPGPRHVPGAWKRCPGSLRRLLHRRC